ncbi:hypothetical protein V6N13_132770 [Hibiscus sabdariffa]
MEIIGEEYFDNLAMCSFFQGLERDRNDGSMVQCKMHEAECYMAASGRVEELRLDYHHNSIRHLTLISDVDVATVNLISDVKKLCSLLLDTRFRISSASFRICCIT